jgi:hypothetical protein
MKTFEQVKWELLDLQNRITFEMLVRKGVIKLTTQENKNGKTTR